MFRVTRLVLLVITVMDATAVITAITSHTTTQLIVVHITIVVVHALMVVHQIVTVVLVNAMDVMAVLAVLDARTVLDARQLVQEIVKADAMVDV